jgi:hypothetical protein
MSNEAKVDYDPVVLSEKQDVSKDKAYIRENLEKGRDVEYQFVNGNKMSLYRSSGDYMLGKLVGPRRRVKIKHLCLTFLEPSGVLGSFYANHSQHFSPTDYDGAIDAFIRRCKCENPSYQIVSNSQKSLERLAIEQSGVLWFESHYDYLDAILEAFWKQVFNRTPDEMWYGGIVGAHGDKAYSHKDEWAKAGIPFAQGVLLFLLSYTKAYPEDKPKHETSQWVIDVYPDFYMKILRAERETLEKYGVKREVELQLYKRDPAETAIGTEEWTVWKEGRPLKAFSITPGQDPDVEVIRQYLAWELKKSKTAEAA